MSVDFLNLLGRIYNGNAHDDELKVVGLCEDLVAVSASVRCNIYRFLRGRKSCTLYSVR